MARLIDIEGIDGSGKGTQSRLLCQRLQDAGYSTQLISFPRYDATFFGQAIGEFLNGQFGELHAVHPLLVSLLFAGDRFESKPLLVEALATHQVVVLDRYVPSNVAHQASKCTGPARRELTRRILHLEYEIYALPRPDLVLLLSLPSDLARQLVSRKPVRNYTDKVADIQEADQTYMQGVYEVYEDLARTQPGWHAVPCSTSGVGCDSQVRSVDAIAADVWSVVQPLLERI